MGDDRCAVQAFGTDFSLSESLLTIANRLCRSFLIIRLRSSTFLGMNCCRTNGVDNIISGAILFEAV